MLFKRGWLTSLANVTIWVPAFLDFPIPCSSCLSSFFLNLSLYFANILSSAWFQNSWLPLGLLQASFLDFIFFSFFVLSDLTHPNMGDKYQYDYFWPYFHSFRLTCQDVYLPCPNQHLMGFSSVTREVIGFILQFCCSLRHLVSTDVSVNHSKTQVKTASSHCQFLFYRFHKLSPQKRKLCWLTLPPSSLPLLIICPEASSPLTYFIACMR